MKKNKKVKKMHDDTKIKTPRHPDELHIFAEEANLHPSERRKKTSTVYPWENANPKVKNMRSMMLREEVVLKLQYIKQNTSYSINAFMIEALEEAVDKKIEELTKKSYNNN